MALKAIVETLDDVPEALREHYKEQGDKFVLAVDGIDGHPSVANLKSAHERQKADNKTLKTQLGEATTRLEAFGEMTAEELDELRAAAEKAGNPKAPTKEELDAMVEERFKHQRAKLTKDVETARAEAQQFKTQAETLGQSFSAERISNRVKDAAVKAGIRPKAIGDVARLAHDTWRLDENGDPVAYSGETPLAITMDDWIEGLRADRDYLFEPSKGGGAGGSGGGSQQGGVKVFNGSLKDASDNNIVGKNLESFAKGEAALRG